jgi:hypothetical protein
MGVFDGFGPVLLVFPRYGEPRSIVLGRLLSRFMRHAAMGYHKCLEVDTLRVAGEHVEATRIMRTSTAIEKAQSREYGDSSAQLGDLLH